jgi:hypothetical protein
MGDRRKDAESDLVRINIMRMKWMRKRNVLKRRCDEDWGPIQ